MTIRLVAASLMLLFIPALASAQGMSARQLKKTQRQADKAFEAGRFQQAASLYQQILDSTEPGSQRRSQALYAIALLNISNDAATRDGAAASQKLQELSSSTSFERFDQRLEVIALRSLLQEVGAGHAEIERRGQLLAAKDAEIRKLAQQNRPQRTETPDPSAAAPVDDGRIESLQASLDEALAELAATREELTKKEKALEELTAALVGDG